MLAFLSRHKNKPTANAADNQKKNKEHARRRFRMIRSTTTTDSQQTLQTQLTHDTTTNDEFYLTAINASLSKFSAISACSTPSFSAPSSPTRDRQLAFLPAAAAAAAGAVTRSSSLSPQRRHAHLRRFTMTEDDFNDLLRKSRGWAYDPSAAQTMPHHEREHNRALAGTDFEAFIFRPKGEPGPRLAQTEIQ